MANQDWWSWMQGLGQPAGAAGLGNYMNPSAPAWLRNLGGAIGQGGVNPGGSGDFDVTGAPVGSGPSAYPGLNIPLSQLRNMVPPWNSGAAAMPPPSARPAVPAGAPNARTPQLGPWHAGGSASGPIIAPGQGMPFPQQTMGPPMPPNTYQGPADPMSPANLANPISPASGPVDPSIIAHGGVSPPLPSPMGPFLPPGSLTPSTSTDPSTSPPGSPSATPRPAGALARPPLPPARPRGASSPPPAGRAPPFTLVQMGSGRYPPTYTALDLSRLFGGR